MITLEGIELPDNLTMGNDVSWSGVESIVELTAGGRPTVWEQTKYGRPIVLKGTVDTAWITYQTLKALQALSSTPGEIYSLNYEGTAYNVRFAHENEPALFAVPRIARPNHQDSDEFHSVELRLMEL